MANQIKIKILLKRVHVKNDADSVGSGEFYFDAKIDGKKVGNKRVFDAIEGRDIVLQQPLWSAVVDVTNKTEVEVFFHGKDEDVVSDDDIGSIRYKIKAPWSERDFHKETKYFSLTFSVEIELDGTYGRHAPGEVYACREHNGSLNCTTISGVVIPARLEIHPVRPVPPTASCPPRPPLPPGTPELKVANDGIIPITPASDINIIANPAVIPIIPAAEANAQTAAKIEFTYYRPSTLKFTDSDPRLVWTAVPVSGGNVAFVGPARGLKVKCYGTAAGEVRLEVRFRGALFANYRAIVLPLKKIPCRINILNGPTAASQPRATPADCQAHLAIANRFLRQLGLELTLDTNPTRTNNAKATAIPGIFRINVSAGVTRNINGNADNLTATRLNYRAGVMNFAYIHSDARPTILGVATDYPNSSLAAPAAPPAPANPAHAPAFANRPMVADSGTPSDSWRLPSGVKPDAAAGTSNLFLIRGFPRAGHPQLFAMFVTDGGGDPSVAANQLTYAQTIAHEFGHILNLGHRIEGADATTATGMNANGIFWDGIGHPPNENVMNWTLSGTREQDFDILQARGTRFSTLIPP